LSLKATQRAIQLRRRQVEKQLCHLEQLGCARGLFRQQFLLFSISLLQVAAVAAGMQLAVAVPVDCLPITAEHL
jgi:hypothetical protein